MPQSWYDESATLINAATPNPPCGATVYKSVKLHSDMNCSASDTDGLIVGASNVTINLNGFTLIGPDTGSYTAIDNSGGFNHVTVTDGTVEYYDTGVYFEGAQYANINSVTAEYDNDGIEVENSTDGTVNDSTADYNLVDGVYLESNHMVTVSNSDASYDALGIYDDGSLDTIDADTMNDNGPLLKRINSRAAGITADPAASIRGEGLYVDYPLTAGGLYYTIENSTADNNAGTGFYIDDNSPTALYQANVFGNTAEFNGRSRTGFGYWAYQQVKGTRTNGALGNASGNCFHVPCHNLSP